MGYIIGVDLGTSGTKLAARGPQRLSFQRRPTVRGETLAARAVEQFLDWAEIPRNEVDRLVLTGSSGSGKSLLLSTLTGRWAAASNQAAINWLPVAQPCAVTKDSSTVRQTRPSDPEQPLAPCESDVQHSARRPKGAGLIVILNALSRQTLPP